MSMDWVLVFIMHGVSEKLRQLVQNNFLPSSVLVEPTASQPGHESGTA